MFEAVERWCSEELTLILGSLPSEEIVKYVVSIHSQEELEEFVADLFGHLSAEIREKFVADLQRLKANVNKEQTLHQKLADVRQDNPTLVYHKPLFEPLEDQPVAYRKKQDLPGQEQSNQQGKGKNKGRKSRSVGDGNAATDNASHVMLDPLIPTNTATSPSQNPPGKQRKSGNYVPLFDHVGSSMVVLLPGRHPCLCQASKHPLINNCIKCGRIVCTQEGSGPCFTCSGLVCTPEEQDILRRGSKKSERLLNQLTATDKEQLQRAIAHKNKLLEFNITAAQRTQVIDDECDYFSLASDRWLGSEERKKFEKKAHEEHEKKHGGRFGKGFVVNLDYAGRRVNPEEKYVTDTQSELSKLKLNSKHPSASGQNEQVPETQNESDVHPTIPIPPPVYAPSKDPSALSFKECPDLPKRCNPAQGMRLQDRELQELSDQGSCLSMHQPWASLLVRGIKKHEGRTWYTAYRGLLWIHSGSKVPSRPEISDVENVYRNNLKTESAEDLDFPKQYPSGCLVGCINLVDCLPQEEYRQRYPTGESDSPYVFICGDPQELLVKFPMKGNHKIYKMDQTVHKAVKKMMKTRND